MLVVVVDGGGSKTACAVARFQEPQGWQILGRAVSGASNPSAVGLPAALEAVGDAVRQAYVDADCKVGEAERGVFALAGTLRSDLRHTMQEGIESLALANEVRVVPDLLPILYAASPTGEGVGLIAGTGSVAFARNAQGELRVVGGWGYLLGDEGSGYYLGREALRGLLARLARGETLGPLDMALCRELGVSRSDDIKRVVYSAADPRQQIARLARHVVEQAESTPADETASQLLDHCAECLAQLTREAVPHTRPGAAIALSGGLLTGSRTLVGRLSAQLESAGIDNPIKLILDPLEGCLALTRDSAFAQPLAVV
jgi:glucosamine kinase